MRTEVGGSFSEEQGWGFSSLDLFIHCGSGGGKIDGLPDNGVASLVRTRSDRDSMGLTRRLRIVKDGRVERLQSFLWCKGMDLGVFSRMFPGRYRSYNWSQCNPSSDRLSRVWASAKEMPASSSPGGER